MNLKLEKETILSGALFQATQLLYLITNKMQLVHRQNQDPITQPTAQHNSIRPIYETAIPDIYVKINKFSDVLVYIKSLSIAVRVEQIAYARYIRCLPYAPYSDVSTAASVAILEFKSLANLVKDIEGTISDSSSINPTLSTYTNIARAFTDEYEDPIVELANKLYIHSRKKLSTQPSTSDLLIILPYEGDQVSPDTLSLLLSQIQTKYGLLDQPQRQDSVKNFELSDDTLK